MRTLYIECNMGAAGDMLMSALYELMDEEQKEEFLKRMNGLGLPGVRITPRKSSTCGISGTHMEVTVYGEEEHEPGEEHAELHAGHHHHAVCGIADTVHRLPVYGVHMGHQHHRHLAGSIENPLFALGAVSAGFQFLRQRSFQLTLLQAEDLFKVQNMELGLLQFKSFAHISHPSFHAANLYWEWGQNLLPPIIPQIVLAEHRPQPCAAAS